MRTITAYQILAILKNDKRFSLDEKEALSIGMRGIAQLLLEEAQEATRKYEEDDLK